MLYKSKNLIINLRCELKINNNLLISDINENYVIWNIM